MKYLYLTPWLTYYSFQPFIGFVLKAFFEVDIHFVLFEFVVSLWETMTFYWIIWRPYNEDPMGITLLMCVCGCVCGCGCVCVCVCVCVYMFISFHHKGFSWVNNTINVMPQIRPAMLPWGNFFVKKLCCHIIDNHIRVLQTSNCAKCECRLNC